jgi:N-acetylmuramoyl-L-alanine amidase
MENVGGQYNPQNIYNMRPEEIHYEIARWAIAGNKLTNLGESLWYFNPFKPECQTFFPSQVGVFNSRIVDHCFYDPTPAYYQT